METVVMTSNALNHYLTLTRSPLLLAPILEAFFQEIKPIEKNILLGYLVLPIVLYPPSSAFLQTANSRSSVRTFCDQKSRLAGLPKRVEDLRQTSSLAIQNSIDSLRLTLNADLSLEYVASQPHRNQGMPLEIKAARRLAMLLDPYDVITAYRLLGVKNL